MGRTKALQGHVLDLSDLKISLHTDQQTIILNELTSQKKKLEEENQNLREKLEDADVVIKLLKQKLLLQDHHKKHKKHQHQHGSSLSLSLVGGLLGQTKATSALRALEHSTQKKDKKGFFGIKSACRHKSTFQNPSAPGKKAFENRSGGTSSSDKTLPSVIVIPNHITSPSTTSAATTDKRKHHRSQKKSYNPDRSPNVLRSGFKCRFGDPPGQDVLNDKNRKITCNRSQNCPQRQRNQKQQRHQQEKAAATRDHVKQMAEQEAIPDSIIDQLARALIQEHTHSTELGSQSTSPSTGSARTDSIGGQTEGNMGEWYEDNYSES